jgi:anti-sigma factor RsiW
MPRVHHLQEQQLLDVYVAERCGAAVDPPLAEHLADCDGCGHRYAALTRFMDLLRAEAVAEADAIFTPDRLRAQQVHVARRLEQVGRVARVLSFPSRFVSGRLAASGSRRPMRWAAAAAAAGLFVGVGVGMFYDLGPQTRRAREARQVATAVEPALMAPAAPMVIGAALDATDDDFLVDLDIALERPQTSELMPFDELTPQVVEISETLR